MGYNIKGDIKMPKSEYIRARIEPDLKNTVGCIFKTLGLSTSEAITLFFRQVELHKGLPFDVKIPNKLTLKTFEETDKGIDLNYVKDIDDLFDQLDKE